MPGAVRRPVGVTRLYDWLALPRLQQHVFYCRLVVLHVLIRFYQFIYLSTALCYVLTYSDVGGIGLLKHFWLVFILLTSFPGFNGTNFPAECL